LALDLRYTELLRETGGDILWDDAGWDDKWGRWNAPDWRVATQFLAKHGIKWALWYPTFLASLDSQVALEHPDWVIANRAGSPEDRKQDVLEQSIRATADWQRRLLDRSVAEW